MGEVIEFNLVSRKNLMKDLMHFMKKKLKGENIRYKFEIMDNWEYQNAYEIDKEEMLSELVESKIVTVTIFTTFGNLGLSGEYQGDVYIYCIWHHPKNEIPNERNDCIYDFIDFISHCYEKKEMIICAIGQETKFEYENELAKTVKSSHNIDIWIISDQYYNPLFFHKYRKCKIRDYQKGESNVVITA